MSIANLINGNPNKSWLDCNCDEITCRDINCINLDAQNIIVPGNVDINNLFVKKISASLPNTEIEINDDMIFDTANLNLNNNNIITADNIELNSLSKNGSGEIQINDQIIFNSILNINNNVCSSVSQLNSDHGTAINFFPGGSQPDIINLDAGRILISGGFLDMDNNNMVEVGEFTFGTTPTQDDTETRLLVLNTADDTIEYRDVSSLPGSNPFDQDLNTTDNVEFADVTADNFFFTDYTNRSATYLIIGKSILANTDTSLTNWTEVVSSPFINVNPVTGIFTPVDGYYTMTYQSTITSTSGVIQMGVRLINNLAQTIYLNVQPSTDLYQPETGFEGTQYENLSSYFLTGPTYSLNAKFSTAETANFSVKIDRLF